MTILDDNRKAFSVHIRVDRHAFAGDALFEDFDLQLPAGRWTCLLGPSGVGKTQLLRLILGLEHGAQGCRVSCSDGRSLTDRVAYMAQSDLLLPWLNLLDNVTLGNRLRRQSADRRRALELLKAVGLDQRHRERPAALSGGMRQRAALARTLMEDRAVVIMDEPFSAVDAISRLRLQDLACTMLRGRTVLLVTHDPLEALRVGHHVHVLSGRPAKLGQALTPPGTPPRAPGDEDVLAMQAALLQRLAEAVA